MRRLAPPSLVLIGTLAAGGLLLGPGDATGGGSPSPRRFEPLDPSDFTAYEVFEGDGPPLERFAPDAFTGAPAPVPQSEIPAPEGYPVDFRHYPGPEAIEAFLRRLEAEHPELVEVYEIGRSWQDRPIHAVRLTDERGDQPIADRPVAYLDGQHHARELISSQVALYSLWWLVEHYGEQPLATRLLESRVVHVVPSVNVDGNRIALEDFQVMRKTANPSCCDDDGDGRVDEDPVTGYGYGTDTIAHWTFDLDWATAHPEDPFVEGWRDHLLGSPSVVGRFTGALGGPTERIEELDEDGDGRLDEDMVGGVDANRNYDWHWEGGNANPRGETYRGPEPWSEPEVRALRDYLSELDHLALGISYHSGVDVILFPWGHSGSVPLPDAGMYELLARKGSQLTEVHGFRGSPRTWTAQGLYPGFGSTLDHLYGTLGAFAFTPEVYGGSATTRIERIGATGTFTVGQSTAAGFNPRPEDILASADRWHRYATYLIAATPKLELNGLAIEGQDLVITLGNEGVMPVGLDLRLEGAAEPRQLSRPEDRVYHNEQVRWRVPREALGRSGNRLALEVVLQTGTRPHRVERAEWAFDLGPDGQVVLTEGRLRPYVDLGPQLGGWWAGEAWNDPVYRCPRGPESCPPQIIASPPPGGVAPTPTPATSPTPPTPGRPAPKALLPWLGREG